MSKKKNKQKKPKKRQNEKHWVPPPIAPVIEDSTVLPMIEEEHGKPSLSFAKKSSNDAGTKMPNIPQNINISFDGGSRVDGSDSKGNLVLRLMDRFHPLFDFNGIYLIIVTFFFFKYDLVEFRYENGILFLAINLLGILIRKASKLFSADSYK